MSRLSLKIKVLALVNVDFGQCIVQILFWALISNSRFTLYQCSGHQGLDFDFLFHSRPIASPSEHKFRLFFFPKLISGHFSL